MASEKIHKRCGGTGIYRRASGMDDICFPCSGTGRYTPATAEQRAAQNNWQHAWLMFTGLRRGGDVVAPEGMPFYQFRSGMLTGLESLAEQEPERLPKLYASLAAGRLQAVATALYRYSQEG